MHSHSFIRLLSQSFQPNGHCFDCCAVASSQQRVGRLFAYSAMLNADGVFLFVPSVLALWCESSSTYTASDANSLLFKLVAVETDSLSLPFVGLRLHEKRRDAAGQAIQFIDSQWNFHCQDIALWFGNHRRVGCYTLFAVAGPFVNS